MTIMKFLAAFLAAVFAENLFFTRAMDAVGIRDLWKSPKKIIEYGALTTAVLAVAGPFSYLLNKLIRPLPFYSYVAAVSHVLLLTGLYAAAYLLLKKYVPVIFEQIGRALPFAAFNCAAFGTLLLVLKDSELDRWWKCLAYELGAGVGFTLALLLMWSIRQRQMSCDAPKSFRGLPLQLVTAGIIALALAGLVGNQLPA